MVSIVVVAGLFPNTDASAFLPALAAIPLHAILGVQTTGLRARGRAGLAQFAESVVLPLTTCVMLTLGHVISGWSELGILQAAFLGILMATLVNASLLRRTSYLERCGADIPVPNAEVLRRASSVLFVGLVASTLCTRAPTIVLARLGSPEEVAVFDAALRIASLGTLILWAIRISFSPQFSRLAAAGDYMGLRRVVRIASTLAGGAAMLCLLMFVILGPWLLGAFGEVYLDAWVPLLILSGSLGLNCLLGLCGTALIMAGHESFVVKVSFLQLFVLVILTPLLLPAYGVIGMVSSMAMALLIRDLTALIKFVLVTSRGRLTAVEADAGATSLR
jgi:O-antigen/teichoic acid export membrane protein